MYERLVLLRAIAQLFCRGTVFYPEARKDPLELIELITFVRRELSLSYPAIAPATITTVLELLTKKLVSAKF